MGATIGGIGAARLSAYRAAREEAYRAARPVSARLAGEARGGWVNGVPMQWMTDWPMPYPLFIERGEGCRLTDVDGHDYADFCLGDTGAMFGHASPPVVAAVTAQAARGFTHMLPTADAAVVGGCSARRSGCRCGRWRCRPPMPIALPCGWRAR